MGHHAKGAQLKSRMGKVVNDIVMDFSCKPRISDDRGTAILVAGSIYEACQYFELFQLTPLRGKCGIITSYNPSTRDIVTEETGENTETEKQAIYNIYNKLLGKKTTEEYEERGQRPVHQAPGSNEAANRGIQAAHWF